MEQLKRLLIEQGEAFSHFKAKNDARLSALEKKASRPGVGADPTTHSNTDTPTLDFGPEYKEAFQKFVRKGVNFHEIAEEVGFSGSDALTKAMSTATGADGGYAVPTELDGIIDEVLRQASPMRQVCTVRKVYTSDYKKLVNLHGSGHGWVGETDARPDTDSPQLAEITPSWGELYANPQISQHLLDDSFFSIEEFIQNELGGLFAKQEGDAFVNGDGTNKPRGFLDYPSATTGDDTRAFGTLQHVVAASATAVTADELLNFSYQLRAPYRANACWLMRTETLAAIRGLKDSNGNYLWQSGLQLGQPEMLLGKPVYECPDMPAMAAGNAAIAFGDFRRGYYIVDRLACMLRDPYTNKPYVGFYTTKRVGGMVVDSQAIKVIQMAAA